MIEQSGSNKRVNKIICYSHSCNQWIILLFYNYTNKIQEFIFFHTPSQSAPVRFTLGASPVNKFAEIASPVPNYAFPANK